MGDFLDKTGLARVKAKIDALLAGKLDTSLKGAASGIAELDENGKVISSQLPSSVNEVNEYSSSSSFPLIGSTDKIYIDTSTNYTYRWNENEYVRVNITPTELNVLSGRMGDLTTLNTTDKTSLVSAINEVVGTYVQKGQGSENAGKFLVVGLTGAVELQTIQAASGMSF